MLQPSQHEHGCAHGQERNQLLAHFVVLTEPGNSEYRRQTLCKEEKRPPYGLIESAGLEMAEGRVVHEIVDWNGAVEGEMDDNERSAEETRKDIFVEQPVARLQHVELISRDRVAAASWCCICPPSSGPCQSVCCQRHWLGNDREDSIRRGTHSSRRDSSTVYVGEEIRRTVITRVSN